MKLFREKVFTNFSAIEQKWLVRIVLRDMKLGLRHESVLKWIHEEVRAYSLCFSASLLPWQPLPFLLYIYFKYYDK